MAIAIVDHDALQIFAKGIEFPFDHRMNLTIGGIGFDSFDKFIRKNIRWIQELDFRKDKHVKLWTSAKITGPVPKPEDFYSRTVMSGTDDCNRLEPWYEQDAHKGNSPAHVNFIGATMALAMKYIADFKLTETGEIDVVEYIRIIVADKAEDTYLGYGLEVPVEKLWNIHYKTDGVSRFWMERSEFDSVQPFEDVEHFYVREITNQSEINARFDQNEDGVWYRHIDEVPTVTDVEVPSLVGFEDTNDSYTSTVLVDDATIQDMLTKPRTLGISHLAR